MKGNHWGKLCGITAFGESYSPAVGVVIEDIKPGIEFPIQDIQRDLDRRRPGKGAFTSPRQEKDQIVILSGVFEGKTTGMPICMIVYNRDLRIEDYQAIKDVFRPSHADLSWYKKFKIYDYRGGGRASGRETIARVAAGALVCKILEPIRILLYPVSIGDISTKSFDHNFLSSNELQWPCPQTYEQLVDRLRSVKEKGDSIGGVVHVLINNVPAGLGDPVFEKLDANLAKAIISIGGIKGIEFGKGFDLGQMKGSQANDPILSFKTSPETDKSGGISGGISSGNPISFRFVVKPTPSISIPQQTIDKEGNQQILKLSGRFDTCLIPRIIPVAEAMIKLVLADALSYQKLIEETPSSLDTLREMIDKIDEDILLSLLCREKIVKQIAAYKRGRGIEICQKTRERELMEDIMAKAIELNLDPRLIKDIWQKIIDQSRKSQ